MFCGFATPLHSTGDAIMPTLREKMKQEMRLRGFSLATQVSYLRGVVKLHDHYKRNPAKLTELEIKGFLLPAPINGRAPRSYKISV